MSDDYLLTRQEGGAPRGVPAVSLTWVELTGGHSNPGGSNVACAVELTGGHSNPGGSNVACVVELTGGHSNPGGSNVACGGAEGIRTPDPLHAMEVRYQLRYSPAAAHDRGLPLP